MIVRTEIVGAAPRLLEVERPWQDLWARTGADIFQSHGWIGCWWQAVASRSGISLRVALAWRGEELVGVLPLVVQRRGGLRVLQWAAEAFSDYCDVLLAPDQDVPMVLGLLWAAVAQAGGFDLVRLKQVRGDAHAKLLLDMVAEARGYSRWDPADRSLQVRREWPDGHAWFRSIGKKARNNHTRGKRILTELGGEPAFRCYGPGERLGPVLDRLSALKRDWLKANDPASALLGDEGAVQRAVLDAMATAGELTAFTIECQERVVAVSINFVGRARMQAYMTSYDLAFGRASPGTMLIVEYTMWAFDRGLGEVDFLRGDEAFKLGMANAETRLNGITAASSVLGHMALAAHGWRARARALRGAPAGNSTATGAGIRASEDA